MQEIARLNSSKTPTPIQFVSSFIGKNVIVDSFDYVIEGKLLFFRMGQKDGHIPDLLILENSHGVHFIRNWNIIKIGYL